MREYSTTILIAAVIAFLATPIVRKFASKSGAVMKIRARDIHELPTPRWGGLALWVSVAITLLIARNLPLVEKSFSRETLGIFVSATFILVLGMIDDRFDLDPLTKFAGQALAAAILVVFGVQLLWLPINGILTLPPTIGQILTILFVMVVINAVNFVDGLDGLAVGLVAISSLSFFAFSYLLAIENGYSRAGTASLMTALVLGTCLGFLPHNFFPARIFMGDSGAMFLGLILSASAITLTGQIDISELTNNKQGAANLPLILPITILAVPLLDFLLAIIRRVKAGRSPFTADREHLHHKIMRFGNSQQRTTVILYLISAMFAFPTVMAAFLPIWQSLICGFAIMIFVLISIGLFRNKPKKNLLSLNVDAAK